MRKVKVYKYEQAVGKTYHHKIDDGEATFHRWGINYDELENGAGSYSTAIIERQDGSVENVEVSMIQFISL